MDATIDQQLDRATCLLSLVRWGCEVALASDGNLQAFEAWAHQHNPAMSELSAIDIVRYALAGHSAAAAATLERFAAVQEATRLTQRGDDFDVR